MDYKMDVLDKILESSEIKEVLREATDKDYHAVLSKFGYTRQKNSPFWDHPEGHQFQLGAPGEGGTHLLGKNVMQYEKDMGVSIKSPEDLEDHLKQIHTKKESVIDKLAEEDHPYVGKTFRINDKKAGTTIAFTVDKYDGHHAHITDTLNKKFKIPMVDIAKSVEAGTMKMVEAGRWVYPLDPSCPHVKSFERGQEDPMMKMSGCADEFRDDFERSHRKKCKRCMNYGLENVDVDY